MTTAAQILADLKSIACVVDALSCPHTKRGKARRLAGDRISLKRWSLDLHKHIHHLIFQALIAALHH